MKYLDLTLPSPAENLACDEALLDLCDKQGLPDVLRTWESPSHFVVVGYANKVETEVNRSACEQRCIPVFRRCSGGGTVVQGPGCLNYSLILNFTDHPSLQTITGTNEFVMGRHRELLETFLGKPVQIEGHTDLAMKEKSIVVKFSGNAQRRKRNALLFHGTFLLNFDLSLIETLLRMPSFEPSYRQHRSHQDFIRNLEKSSAGMKTLLRQGWNAEEEFNFFSNLGELAEKYRSDAWNFRF